MIRIIGTAKVSIWTTKHVGCVIVVAIWNTLRDLFMNDINIMVSEILSIFKQTIPDIH
jgi:hypothetical protein